MIMLRIFFVFVINIFITHSVFASELPVPLVETKWLAENLENVTLLDVRSNAKSFTSQPIFKTDKKSGKTNLIKVGGHIPGANLVLYKNVRATRNINGQKVKGLVPDKKSFNQLMKNAGVNKNSKVVIVTNAETGFDVTMAARAYWQMKYFGHDEVAILNGGTAQWLLDKREYSIVDSKPSIGDWQASTERENLLASSEEVATAIEEDSIQILDARPLSQYLGISNGTKKGVGHVPSAKIFPVELMTTTSAPVKFLAEGDLHELANAFNTSAEDAVITYCNSGHMASGSWFVMHELLGNQHAQLYDGSMNQWNAEKRPSVRMIIE